MSTRTKWFCLPIAAMFLFAGGAARGQGNSHGHGHGHDKEGYDNGGDGQGSRFYDDHDQDVMRVWYGDHRGHLPPGLAKKDQLAPGLEKQLIERGTLPPGLRKKIEPCPEDLERRLPPPPPDYEDVVIGGHIVLLNRRTYVVADIFHFELH